MRHPCVCGQRGAGYSRPMTVYATADDQKRAAALAALNHIDAGMKLGLGTGSTAEHFVRALGEKVRGGLKLGPCVPTSERTAQLALEFAIPLGDLNVVRALDLYVDGADEVDGDLNMIKGAGGALLREKMVAAAARTRVIVADGSKRVDVLGRFPLSVEIVPFAWKVTAEKAAALATRFGCDGNLIRLRGGEAHPFVTDNGNFVVDVDYGRIPDAPALAAALSMIPGVVEHGLFIGLCDILILGGAGGVETREAG